MKLKVDIGISNICKKKEEVCGDTTNVIRTKNSSTVILSDGLGSGIKASILSILSTRIASRLLKQNIELEQVFETIAGTLPICQVRGIAYSTLTILKIEDTGRAHLIEYDNPSLIAIRKNELLEIKKKKKKIAGKVVAEAFFQVERDDILLLISDGVINAGVGGLFKLGLGQERLLENIFSRDILQESPDQLAKYIIGLTKAYYQGEPGDDSTCVALKLRSPRRAIILTGPPTEKSADRRMVNRFIAEKNCKQIICGGATGKMVARELGRRLKTSMEYVDSSVPPIGFIEGIDLVTEGILTLNKAYELLKRDINNDKLYDTKNKHKYGGASDLIEILKKADKITFLMGTAVNPAHKELMESLQLKPRPNIIGKLINILRQLGKEVNLEIF